MQPSRGKQGVEPLPRLFPLSPSMNDPRRFPLDRAGVETAAWLFALAAMTAAATLAESPAAPSEAFFRVIAILFASLTYLHIDSWIASVVGAARPGAVLARIGIETLIGALGAQLVLSAFAGHGVRKVPSIETVRDALFAAGLLALGAGLSRWLAFALKLRGRAPSYPEATGLTAGEEPAEDLPSLLTRVARDLHARLAIDGITLMALDREARLLMTHTEASAEALAILEERASLVSGEETRSALRGGEILRESLAADERQRRELATLGIRRGKRLIGLMRVVSSPGRALESVDVLALRPIADRLAAPLAAAAAFARERRRMDRLRSLHEICKGLSGCLSLHELLGAAPDAVTSALGHGRSTICLRQGVECRVAAASEATRSGRDGEALRSAPVTRCFTTRRPVVHRRSDEPGAPPLGFFVGSSSLLVVPLVIGSVVDGVITVESAASRGFSPEEVAAVEALSDFFSISLTNARLYANERQTARRLAIVSEVGRRISECLDPRQILAAATRAIHEGLGHDSVDAALLTADRSAIEISVSSGLYAGRAGALCLEPGTGLIGQALRHKKAVLCAETRADIAYEPLRPETQAALVVPIVCDKSAVGFLNVEIARANGFSGEDIRAIETIADSLAIALGKARHVAWLREQGNVLARSRETEARERRRLEAIIARIPEGVVVLDARDRIELANDAAARLLRGASEGSGTIAGRPLVEVLPEGEIRKAMEAARRGGSGASAPVETDVEIDVGASDERSVRTLRVIVQDLPGSGGLIAVLGDVTAERELAQAKERLFGNLTHDLRSPMSAIIGFSEVLRSGESGPTTSTQLECLDRIVEQGNRLLSLMDEQLDIARLESGTRGIESLPVDLEGILREVTGGLQGLARERGVALSTEATEIPLVPGDSSLLYRLFANLVGNALKFTPAGGSVRVTYRATAPDDTVEVAVSDTGIGISLEDQRRLFKRFVRVGGSARESGHGLGLAIVKEIVEQHGGTIAVESDGPGRGTTFRVRIPSALLAEGDVEPGSPPAPSTREAPAAPAGDAGPARSRRRVESRVLLLDLGRGVAPRVGKMLFQAGLAIRIVPSAERFREEMRAFRPTALVVDMDSANPESLLCIESMASEPSANLLPVLLVTGSAGGSDAFLGAFVEPLSGSEQPERLHAALRRLSTAEAPVRILLSEDAPAEVRSLIASYPLLRVSSPGEDDDGADAVVASEGSLPSLAEARRAPHILLLSKSGSANRIAEVARGLSLRDAPTAREWRDPCLPLLRALVDAV